VNGDWHPDLLARDQHNVFVVYTGSGTGKIQGHYKVSGNWMRNFAKSTRAGDGILFSGREPDHEYRYGDRSAP